MTDNLLFLIAVYYDSNGSESNYAQRFLPNCVISLYLIGTHNAGSYSIQESSPTAPDLKFGLLISFLGYFFNIRLSDWSVTQRADFMTQLQCGIRYFDMRIAMRTPGCVASTSNSSLEVQSCFYLVHGLYAKRVDEELQVINSFLKTHPKEVVIVDFQHFYDFNASLKLAFKDFIKDTFRDRLEPYRNQIPTLSDLWSRGKQVIVMGYEKKPKEHEDGDSVLWPRSSIRQPWPDTRSPDNLGTFLSNEYTTWMRANKSANFFVFQGILSPDLDYILSNSGSGIQKLAEMANAIVKAWLNGLKWLQGIVITDFSIVGFPSFARSVFAKNW
uniref:PLCXc domain-containing protein n=1 Tax=Mesocestoides corti TaxID=53468 RepID=A0A5K3EV15_MESCO